MATFMSEMERIIKANGDRGMDHILYYHGVELELWRQIQKDDAYSRVHNKNAGVNTQKIKEFIGAIAGDDFFPSTATQTGVFQTAWLFTKDLDVLPGDEIRIKREDGKKMSYKIEEKSSIGQTTEIYPKWELSGIT